MKIFLVFSILVAICYTQTPTRPMIPETFESQVNVVYYEHDVYHGNGRIARNEAKNTGIENLVAMIHNMSESRIRLERYDMSEEFFIRGSGNQMHCEKRQVNSTTLPPYWGWLEKAKYMGHKKIKEETLDVWQYNGPGVTIDLLVDASKVNVPRYVNTSLGAGVRELSFVGFNPVTPPASVFDIPSICM